MFMVHNENSYSIPVFRSLAFSSASFHVFSLNPSSVCSIFVLNTKENCDATKMDKIGVLVALERWRVKKALSMDMFKSF